ncbi:hypothetical protein [Parashewanella tropica]|uniref:hypothetical protein n=1 Tax=Parashewanella tropica TaxID=2547970 RepID=UPI001059AA4F|nr:hypothetical protein [Parashewanella tropica]
MSPIDSVTSSQALKDFTKVEDAKPNFDADKIKAMFGREVEKKFAEVDKEISKLQKMFDNIQSQDPSQIIDQSNRTLDLMAKAFESSIPNPDKITPEQNKLLGEVSKHYTDIIFSAQGVARNMATLQVVLAEQNEKLRQQMKD